MYIKTILRLLIRIIRQKTYKTLRTIRSKERLLGTIWVEANKVKINNLIDRIGRNEDLFNEAKDFEKKFRIKQKDIIKNLPISGGLKGSSGGGGGNIFILYAIFDKRDYFNNKGLAKTQIGNFKRALEKNDKGAQKLLDAHKGNMDSAISYIEEFISDGNKKKSFESFQELKIIIFLFALIFKTAISESGSVPTT